MSIVQLGPTGPGDLLKLIAPSLVPPQTGLVINYFVRPGGSNSNDGLSPATAFASIRFALDNVVPLVLQGMKVNLDCTGMIGASAESYVGTYELQPLSSGNATPNGSNAPSSLFVFATQVLVDTLLAGDVTSQTPDAVAGTIRPTNQTPAGGILTNRNLATNQWRGMYLLGANGAIGVVTGNSAGPNSVLATTINPTLSGALTTPIQVLTPGAEMAETSGLPAVRQRGISAGITFSGFRFTGGTGTQGARSPASQLAGTAAFECVDSVEPIFIACDFNGGFNCESGRSSTLASSIFGSRIGNKPITGQSGAAASIIAGAAAGRFRVSGLTGMTAGSVGHMLELGNTASPGNNGWFAIQNFVNGTTVDVLALVGSGALDGSGAITWVEAFAASYRTFGATQVKLFNSFLDAIIWGCLGDSNFTPHTTYVAQGCTPIGSNAIGPTGAVSFGAGGLGLIAPDAQSFANHLRCCFVLGQSHGFQQVGGPQSLKLCVVDNNLGAGIAALGVGGRLHALGCAGSGNSGPGLLLDDGAHVVVDSATGLAPGVLTGTLGDLIVGSLAARSFVDFRLASPAFGAATRNQSDVPGLGLGIIGAAVGGGGLAGALASLGAPAANHQTVTFNALGGAIFSALDVGGVLIMTGNTNAPNNGSFPILKVNSATSVDIDNPAGVADAAPAAAAQWAKRSAGLSVSPVLAGTTFPTTATGSRAWQ